MTLPADSQQLAAISAEAVEKATGRNWQQWIDFLDKQQAADRPHKELVTLLADEVSSSWWRQKIAIGYQQAKGKRTVGQAANGFQLGVQKVFPLTVTQAWNLLTSAERMEIWLGESLAIYDTASAYSKNGEVKVCIPYSHVRIRWQPAHWPKPSTLQIRVIPTGEKATISFLHEDLADEKTRKQMIQHWKRVINQLYQSGTAKKL